VTEKLIDTCSPFAELTGKKPTASALPPTILVTSGTPASEPEEIHGDLLSTAFFLFYFLPLDLANPKSVWKFFESFSRPLFLDGLCLPLRLWRFPSVSVSRS